MTIAKKISLIGDFGVGKTSLIRRFIDCQFSEHYLSTVGVQISRKVVEIDPEDGGEKQAVQLLIWDLEGRTKFQSIVPAYLRGSHGAIVVADLNRPETVAHLQEHLALLESIQAKDMKVVVAFNKADLLKESAWKTQKLETDFEEDSRVLKTYFTSAKTGENVQAVFEKLARSLLVPGIEAGERRERHRGY